MLQATGFVANQISMLTTPDVAASAAVGSICLYTRPSYYSTHGGGPVVDMQQGSKAMILDAIQAAMPQLNGTGIKIGESRCRLLVKCGSTTAQCLSDIHRL
jgi:hypothetical protein